MCYFCESTWLYCDRRSEKGGPSLPICDKEGTLAPDLAIYQHGQESKSYVHVYIQGALYAGKQTGRNKSCRPCRNIGKSTNTSISITQAVMTVSNESVKLNSCSLSI